MEKISDKLYSIVVLLEKDDIRKINLELKLHKNKKLEKLQKLMLDSLDTEISKEQAFKKLYERDYKKEDDFLLRNECRLLYNIIKQYLINKELQNDLENDDLLSDYYFLKAIYQKKDKTLFNKEFPSILENSIQQYDYIKAFQLCDLHFIATGAQQMQNVHNIKHAAEIAEKQEIILGELYSLKRYIINTRKINLRTILSGKDKETIKLHTDNNIAFRLDDYNNELISYYRTIEKSLLETDIPKKIKLIEEAFTYIVSVASVNKQFLKEKDFCQINIASYYYINQEFEKADHLFQEFYASKPSVNDYTLTSIINYGNCLLQLDKYMEILDLVLKYKQELELNQRLSGFVTALLCNVYLLTENTNRLRKEIPASFHDLSDPFVFHYRFCLGILYFLEGDTESAIRESRNLCDTITYKKTFEEHLVIAKLMHKFFDKYDKRNAIDFKKYARQILEELNAFEKECSYNFKIFTPSKWLKIKLKNYS